MKIGIIGAGNIGATLAELLSAAGHEVAISNSRGPNTLTDLVERLGNGVQAVTVEQAAEFGDLVIEAIPFGRYRDLPLAPLAGKILITASNYYSQRDGAIDLGGRAQSELVAEHLPQTQVVKAFNTIWFKHLQQQGDTTKPIDERRVILFSGDDPQAKQIVADLIAQIGFGPLDLGSLHASTRQEPDSPLYNQDITVAAAQARLDGK